MRIVLSDLELLVKRINEATNSPVERSSMVDSRRITNIGHFCLDRAYGGNKLVKIVSEGGAQENITHGYVSKKELYKLMQSFLSGINSKK